MTPRNPRYERYPRKVLPKNDIYNPALTQFKIFVAYAAIIAVVGMLTYAYFNPEQAQIWAGLKKVCNGKVVINRGGWNYGDPPCREDN